MLQNIKRKIREVIYKIKKRRRKGETKVVYLSPNKK